jgi:hypothetical protein
MVLRVRLALNSRSRDHDHAAVGRVDRDLVGGGNSTRKTNLGCGHHAVTCLAQQLRDAVVGVVVEQEAH